MRKNRKLKKSSKVVSLVIILLLVFNVFPVQVFAAKNQIEICFIDVTNSTQSSGDASLINCNTKYVLIDGGKSGAYADKLYNYLNKYCKRVNGKIVIEAIIASHNHSDHVGGLTKLLNDTKNFLVKKVIKSSFDPSSGFNAACKNAASVVTLNANSAKYAFTINGTKITVYPPIADPSVENNRSMLTTVKGLMTALFTGDMYYTGIKKAKIKYPEVFNIKGGYDLCKFAHHGHRGGGSGNLNPDVVSEVAWYKANVYSFLYYLTTGKSFVYKDKDINTLSGNELSVRKNFDYIKKNIAESDCYASYQGNLEVEANSSNGFGYGCTRSITRDPYS